MLVRQYSFYWGLHTLRPKNLAFHISKKVQISEKSADFKKCRFRVEKSADSASVRTVIFTDRLAARLTIMETEWKYLTFKQFRSVLPSSEVAARLSWEYTGSIIKKVQISKKVQIFEKSADFQKSADFGKSPTWRLASSKQED